MVVAAKITATYNRLCLSYTGGLYFGAISIGTQSTLATCSCTYYVFVNTTELSNWSVDDLEHQSVDRGQWSVHDRQTARSSGCLVYPTGDDDDDDNDGGVDDDNDDGASAPRCCRRTLTNSKRRKVNLLTQFHRQIRSL